MEATLNPETMTKYSAAELRFAFELVQDETNWKNPICAAIPDHYVDQVTEAVVFFAGCRPTFKPLARKGMVQCNAVGYYNAVGA